MNMNKNDFKKIFLLIIIFFVFDANLGMAEGLVDYSAENKIKVCRDVTCTNPPPEIIYFENGGDSPLIVNAEKGLSGRAWGGELGWVTFNPPYGGVFFADTNTGLLKGTAWSETSGAINFSVTGQKVTIDPKTGEWNGYAFASGPYGGWIKFDCKEDSCLKTTPYLETKKENKIIEKKIEPIKTEIKKEKINLNIIPFKDSFINLFEGTKIAISISTNLFYKSFINLFDGTKLVINTSKDLFCQSFDNLFDGTKIYINITYSIMTNAFSNFNNLIVQEINKINGSTFITSYNNTITFSQKMTKTKDIAIENFTNIIGSLNTDSYNQFYSYLKSSRPLLLSKVEGLFN